MKYKEKKTEEITFELAADEKNSSCFVLRLYVTGTSPQSVRAIENIKKICDAHLQGRYILEVIDLYQKPNLASGEKIVAAPTLIKHLPLPLKRIIGDMSDLDKVLGALDLMPKTAIETDEGKTAGHK